MRKVSIGYNKDDNNITLYFYLDNPFSEEEFDSDISGVITAELCADFSDDVGFNEKIIVIPYPEVYRKKELVFMDCMNTTDEHRVIVCLASGNR